MRDVLGKLAIPPGEAWGAVDGGGEYLGSEGLGHLWIGRAGEGRAAASCPASLGARRPGCSGGTGVSGSSGRIWASTRGSGAVGLT